MKNYRIVVTGGLGFIGSYIVNKCLDDNEVIIIDNLSTGNLNNIDNINHQNLALINEDINNLNLNNVFNNVDYVFHLAAMSNVALSVEKPDKCIENNIYPTKNLINAAINQGVKKIVFSSSSSVYGDNENLPLKESETPMPQSPYAKSKAEGEKLLQEAHNQYGLNYVALRYFNVYGPKQNINSHYAAVIPKFISAFLNNEQPIIYGDGEQTRDFVYADDVAEINIATCLSDFNGIMNVASGSKISINSLYYIIQEVLNSNIEPNYLPEREGEIKHSLGDNSFMKENGFSLKHDSFENNLKETISYFEEYFTQS